ncbi:MAG: replication initiation protein [Rhodomicrobium sp.]
MEFSTTCAERDALAIPQPDWEWSLDRDEAMRQFDEHLRARGFRSASASQKPATASPKKRHRTVKPLPPPANWEEAFARSLPLKPLCADDFELGVYPCRREIALGYRYVQYNTQSRINWLVSDIDRDGAADTWRSAGLPPPNAVMENPDNGHAHIAWQLAVPVSCSDPLAKQMRFLSIVERGYTRRLDSDKAFSQRGLIKNAVHPDWRVTRHHDVAYSLSELARPLERNETRLWTPSERKSGLGRNVSLFDDLRAFAYREVRRFKSDGLSASQFRDRLQEVANGLNLNPRFHPGPLSFSELRGIVVSISRWTWKRFSVEAFNEKQRARIKKRWAGHVSLDESKPWEAEGISRRTWFYRQKAEKAANGQDQGLHCTISGIVGLGGARGIQRQSRPLDRKRTNRPCERTSTAPS